MAVLSPFLHWANGLVLVNYGLWIVIAAALFGSTVSSILLIFEHARVRIERSRVVQNLTSYLPVETAQKSLLSLLFANSGRTIQCYYFKRRLKEFFSDRREGSEESAAILHYFFTKVNQIVEHHGGSIHEYKGDSVLVVWDGDGASCACALNASIEIEREINSTLLSETGVEGLEPLAVGIGIEQGPVLRGSIGPASRRAHTLCGETVSVVLRIQDMTADLSYPILVGEVAARYLQDASLKSLGHYMLPGLTTAHVLCSRVLEKEDKGKKAELKLLKGGIV